MSSINDGIDLETAAELLAALMDDEPETPRPKLPQARRYLRAARWGFDQMVEHRHIGSAFVFHIIGILTVLRAVPSPSIVPIGRFLPNIEPPSTSGGSARRRYPK